MAISHILFIKYAEKWKKQAISDEMTDNYRRVISLFKKVKHNAIVDFGCPNCGQLTHSAKKMFPKCQIIESVAITMGNAIASIWMLNAS